MHATALTATRLPLVQPLPARISAPRRDPLLTILIVSGNPSVREGFCRSLVGQHRHLLLASCGEEALAFIERHEPDLIVTELHQSLVNGWDLLVREKHFRPDHPVFVIAALPTEKTRNIDPLITEFFQEPLELDPVLAAVRSHLGTSSFA